MTDAPWMFSCRWLSQTEEALDGFSATVPQMVTGAALIELFGCDWLSSPAVELGASTVFLS